MSSNAPHGDGLNPPIPSYDEAMLSPGMASNGALPSPSNFDPFSPMGEAFYAPENESRGLLHRTDRKSVV